VSRFAEQALKNWFEVDWEVLPFVLDPTHGVKARCAGDHPQIAPNNVLPPDPVGGPDVFLIKVDVEQAFTAADVILEMDTSSSLTQPQGAWIPGAVWRSGKDDRLTIVSNSYAADQTACTSARCFGTAHAQGAGHQ